MSSHSSSSSSLSSSSSTSSSWLSWLIVVPVGIASGITLAWLWKRPHQTQQQLERAILTDEEYARELIRLKDLPLGLPTRESLFFFGPHSHPPQVTLLNHGSYGIVVMIGPSHVPLSSLLPPNIHADPQDLVYVNNATSAVNAVLMSLDLHPGDIIATPTLTYNACKLAMQHTAQRTGCIYIEFDIPLPITSHQQILNAIQTCIATYGSRIKFMLCDIITSPTAIIMPIDEITALCHAHNILIMLDGAHAIGQVPLDMTSTNADWVCMNLHKWLFGCKGSALLWARKDRQEKLHPVVTSHSFRDDYIHRFWMQATRDNACYVASAQGLAFLKALGEERVHTYNMSLSLWAASYLAQTWNTVGQELCPSDMHAYMRVIATPMILPKHLRDGPYPSPAIDSWVHTLMMQLYDEFNVMVAILCYNYRLYVRISTQIYNVKSEYERLARVIALVAKRQHEAETLL